MQKLYRIYTPLTFPHICTEGSKRDETIVAHILATSDDEVYDYIEKRFYPGNKYQEPGWCAFADNLTRKKILKKKGDYTTQKPKPPHTLFYFGEVYSLGFRWEDLGEVSSEEISILQRLGILPK